MLELFSGTKSMSHVASRIGFSTVTVDIDPATDPDICVDICDWHYASAGLGSFDFIHCSPPCEELSICKTNGERDIEGATAIANRMRTQSPCNYRESVLVASAPRGCRKRVYCL
jgi:hypothetical protein